MALRIADRPLECLSLEGIGSRVRNLEGAPVLLLVRMMAFGIAFNHRRRPRSFAVILALIVFGALPVCAVAATATFPSSPVLDNFTADPPQTPSPHWITPALGEGMMFLDSAQEFTGSINAATGALWNTPFSDPVEVWATINRAGTGDASLYANVAGGTSSTVHPLSGYFIDFGGTSSFGSPGEVSIWRIDGIETETRLTFVGSPYTDLEPGDQIGLSINLGVITAWYRRSGGSWSAVVSTTDPRFTSGSIAIEAIPSLNYGFSMFGGGSPSTPVVSTRTKTSIASSATSVNVGRNVTYTATVAPAPSIPRGTVEFFDAGVAIPGCGGQAISPGGLATCTATYSVPGVHVVTVLYSGSPDAAFAGSTNGPDATVRATQPTSTTLSLSSATPSVGNPVLYKATVSGSPTGGTVSFTDNGTRIKRCTAQAVTSGIATCSLSYRAPGTHRIRASYSGFALYANSSTSAAVTVFLRPRVSVGVRRMIVTIFCPVHSDGCRITPTLVVSLPGVKKAIRLNKRSAKFKAGHTGQFTFLLDNRTHAKLRSYIGRHRHARLDVTVHLVLRDGNRTSGKQTFSYAVRSAAQLALL